MKPIASAKEDMQLVDTFGGSPEAFPLAVPEALLDSVGVAMAVITDRVLARGWQTDGFTQHEGFRVFRYKEIE